MQKETILTQQGLDELKAKIAYLSTARRQEVADELRWVIDGAEELLGVERAGRYLRKFYPWYADTLGLSKAARQTLVTAPTTAHARQALDALTSAATAQIAA